MKTCVEQLPVEIWLSIFSYFEAHELFRAFTNLNYYFDSLLTSDYLLFYLRLKKSDEYDNFLLTNTKFNRIICLQSTIWHLYEGFSRSLHFHLDKFIRLKSLKLHISGSQTNIICQALQKLQTLEYLSLRCQMTEELFVAILSVSTLHVCHLEFYKSINESINYHSNQISNIQTLYINISNRSDYLIMNLFLFHMLKLKRLEILNWDYDYSNSTISFLQESLILSKIEIVKLKWNFKYIQKDIFEQLIKTMPMLKRFYLDTYCHYLNKVFFTNLIHHWWLIIINIEQFYIFIRGYADFYNISSNDRRKKLDNYRESFLSRNDEFNQHFKVTWTQNNPSEMIYIEILIC